MQATIQPTLSVRAAIESRRSIRRFVQEPIPKEDLDEIFRLTRLAPSAWNLQPWRFVAVSDPELKEQLQAAAYGQKQVTSAPVVILVCSDMEDVMAHLEETVHPGMSEAQKSRELETLNRVFGGQSVKERGMWALTQTNIVLGNLMLVVQSMGYTSVPMLGFDQTKVREILGLPEHVLFAAMLPIGRPSEPGFPHHRHSVERIVTYR
ncbi:MAG: nitroreductase family protein [Mycobacterium leprae]